MSILSTLGITDALATTAAQHPAGLQSFSSFLPLMIGFFVLFYFLMIRPQNKRAKEHRNLIENVTKGDEVVSSGGVVGKVSKITDGFIILTVAEGVEITLQKSSVASVLPKGTMKSL